MTISVTPRRPGDTLFLADCALALSLALLGGSVTLFLAGRGLAGVPAAALVPGGWLLGLILVRVYHHPFRALGVAPLAALVTLGLILLGQLFLGWPAELATLVAFSQGLGLGAILKYRTYQKSRPWRFGLAALVGMASAALIVIGLMPGTNPDAGRTEVAWGMVMGLVVLSLVAWGGFARHAVEMAIDPVMRVLYDCRCSGPGCGQIPRTGPVLVIANHAAWFDPLFIAETVPRETAPMMTAGFYDLPGLRWLMRSIFRVIRVADIPARREVPEIRQAIEALDAGQCVVIFPEGYLRRKDDLPLRRFGRGVWQILKDRPETPVIPCWIEGSWGSYFSHHKGPPTRNKRFDFRRRIRVGVADPVVVPPEVLANHLDTRLWLMNRVSEARLPLGLDPLPVIELIRDQPATDSLDPTT